MLLCFGIGWMITNGWSYILLGLGTWLGNQWMIGIAAAYLTILWLPISPEKLITLSIALLLMRWLFPNDEKTLGTLRHTYAELKQVVKQKKKQHRQKREEKKTKGDP